MKKMKQYKIEENEQILKQIAVVADENAIAVTVQESTKGAVICGAMCLICSFYLGPIGFVVGGIVGGLIAYKYASKVALLSIHYIVYFIKNSAIFRKISTTE